MQYSKKELKNRQNVEFRYYEMPPKSYLMALLGERWILNYGTESMHFHNYLEIGYCYYGEGNMVMGDRQCEYSGEMFTVIPKNQPHCTRSESHKVSRWEYLFIDVEGFLNQIYADKPVMAQRLAERINCQPFIKSLHECTRIGSLILNVLEEMRSQEEFYKESVQGHLLSLLVEIARISQHDVKWQFSEQNTGRITKTLDYIAQHYAEEIRVETLAELCHVSETHFRRVFEKVMNTTPVEYMNMVRIQKACTLLKETTKSIEEIREKVGFSTASTFNRNFKRIVGMSPGQWRIQSDNRLVNYKVSIYKGW